MSTTTDDLAKRREAALERASLDQRYAKLKDDISSLPPREQLRLAADFAEAGKVDWAIQIGRHAIARLVKGDTP
jgi:hypothetical protein